MWVRTVCMSATTTVLLRPIIRNSFNSYMQYFGGALNDLTLIKLLFIPWERKSSEMK